jgi:hypothetical protein
MEHILTSKQSFAVFTMDATATKWWQRYLKKPFWHVLIIHAEVENGKHFVKIEDPVVDFKNWSVKPRQSEPIEVVHWYSFIRDYRYFCMRNNQNMPPKVVKIKIVLDKYNCLHKILLKLPFCTTYVAKMFGIATYAITPFQLYQILKRKGCIDLL